MQFITTIPRLTTEIENGAWHCLIESRGSHFYRNPSLPINQSMLGAWDLARLLTTYDSDQSLHCIGGEGSLFSLNPGADPRMVRIGTGPPFWQINHANSAYFRLFLGYLGVISATRPPLFTYPGSSPALTRQSISTFLSIIVARGKQKTKNN